MRGRLDALVDPGVWVSGTGVKGERHVVDACAVEPSRLVQHVEQHPRHDNDLVKTLRQGKLCQLVIGDIEPR